MPGNEIRDHIVREKYTEGYGTCIHPLLVPQPVILPSCVFKMVLLCYMEYIKKVRWVKRIAHSFKNDLFIFICIEM